MRAVYYTTDPQTAHERPQAEARCLRLTPKRRPQAAHARPQAEARRLYRPQRAASTEPPSGSAPPLLSPQAAHARPQAEARRL